MIRTVIADDHAIVRGGLKRIMATTPDIEVVAEATDAPEVMRVVQDKSFDVLVLDITMPGTTGMDLLHRVRELNPSLPVLMLSMHNEGQVVQRALKGGAAGYVTKDSDPEILLTAIRKVAAGGRFIDNTLVDSVVFASGQRTSEPHALLSEREFQVLRMIVAGRALGDIAADLTLSPKTVSTHKMRLMQKLGVTNNADLIKYAVRHGISGE